MWHRMESKWGLHEFFFYFFNLIQLSALFKKCANCLFELQKPFSQNDAISNDIFFSVFSELTTLHSCVIHHFKINSVQIFRYAIYDSF